MRYSMLPLILLVAFTTNAASSAQEPWHWQLEERLAQRLDPVQIERRESAHRADISGRLGVAQLNNEITNIPVQPVLQYVIDGKRNPELFLPHELFDSVLTAFTPDESLCARQRQFYAPGIRSFGFNEDDFWQRLSSVADNYASLKYGSMRSATGSDAAVQLQQNLLCRARYDALQAARQMFGNEHFDRFLYTVVAPATSSSYATTDRDPAAALRRADGGCQ